MLETTPLDTRALTERLDRAAARAEFRSLQDGGEKERRDQVRTLALAGGFITILGFGLTMMVAFMVDSDPARGPQTWLWYLPWVFLLALPALVGYGIVQLLGPERREEEEFSWRIRRFAAANELEYRRSVANPGIPSSLFRGTDRRALRVLRQPAPRHIEIGRHLSTLTSSRRRSRTEAWAYIAIRSAVPLPNMFLDARANDPAFGDPAGAGFRDDQRLRLEGDFDRHFALYCPAGYETDALYLFTPDVMERLIDTASAFDVELVDEWVILTSAQHTTTLDPARWRHVQGAIQAVTAKLDQWDRWRDDRVADDEAPTPGITTERTAPIPAMPAPVPALPRTPVSRSSARIIPNRPLGVAGAGRRLRRTRWPLVRRTLLMLVVFAVVYLLTRTDLFGFTLLG